MKLCPKCNTDNPVEANFCRRCAYQFNEYSVALLEKQSIELKEKVRELDERFVALKSEYRDSVTLQENKILKVKYSKLKEEKDRYERWWCEELKSVSLYKKLFISFLVAFLLTISAGIIGAIYLLD